MLDVEASRVLLLLAGVSYPESVSLVSLSILSVMNLELASYLLLLFFSVLLPLASPNSFLKVRLACLLTPLTVFLSGFLTLAYAFVSMCMFIID